MTKKNNQIEPNQIEPNQRSIINFEQQKHQLHQLIDQSDLSGLKTYVDLLQTSLISFDDPSLLLMAIKVYLDPNSLLIDRKLQLEIIIFLAKSGLQFYLPGGTFILKIYEYSSKYSYWGNNNKINNPDEFNQKIHLLMDHILQDGHPELLRNILPIEILNEKPLFIRKHQSAIRIQRAWRRNRNF